MAVLVWIASRSFKCAERDAVKSFPHAAGDLPLFAPLTTSLTEAKRRLFDTLAAGELSGLACKHMRAASGLAWRPSIEPADTREAFPPASDLALISRLEELPDSVVYRNCFFERAQPPSRTETVWRNLTFARADVLSLWGEHPKALGHRRGKATLWKPPEGLDKSAFAVLPQGARIPLDPVVNMLAFAALEEPRDISEVECVAARMSAAYALFAAARDQELELYGTPAQPRECLGNPLFPAGPRERISPLAFDNDALALSHLQSSAIGTEEAAARYPDEVGWRKAVMWYEVTVGRASLAKWLGEAIGANKRRGAIKDLASCRDWLIGLRKSGRPSKTKAEYKAEGMQRFGVGPDQFRTAWMQAAVSFPSDEWGKPGRPEGRIKSRGG